MTNIICYDRWFDLPGECHAIMLKSKIVLITPVGRSLNRQHIQNQRSKVLALFNLLVLYLIKNYIYFFDLKKAVLKQ